VSASANRRSILQHGLDSLRKSCERGIAGSPVAENEGVFLARDREEADWFVMLGNERGPRSLDVWEVTLDGEIDLHTGRPDADSPFTVIHGFICWLAPIPPNRLRLVVEGEPRRAP
jgi:hypothetical protein